MAEHFVNEEEVRIDYSPAQIAMMMGLIIFLLSKEAPLLWSSALRLLR
jgi:hypothetical protein